MPRLNLFRLFSYLIVLFTVLITFYIFNSNQTYKKLALKEIEQRKKLIEENYKEKKTKEKNLLLKQKEKIINNVLDVGHLIYNRVPKCGSMSVTTLFYRLGSINKFQVTSPWEPGEKQEKSDEEENEFVNMIRGRAETPMAYIRHIYFVDFKIYKQKQPLYVNILRDPIERFVSFYYFTRWGNSRGGGKSKMNEERKNETVDDCVRKRRNECTNPYWQVVPYFCGNYPGCMSRSRWAVERAKHNIDNNYLFVGTIEDLDTSLEILEYIAPQYFKNAKKLYHENPENQKVKKETKTKNKQPTSEETKKFLREQTSLMLEYELYNFVNLKMYNLAKFL